MKGAKFLTWLKAGAPSKTLTVRGISHPDGRLRPDAAAFLSRWVADRKSKPGRIMKEIGSSVFDWTLAHAIDHCGMLRKEVIAKLGPWVMKAGFRQNW
jgi:hypothetical protein